MNDPLTEKIIGAAFQAHITLGLGFLECVYEWALSTELDNPGIAHALQAPFRRRGEQHAR